MNSIWKINSDFTINDNIPFNNLYFCSHCVSHCNSLMFRKLLIKINNPPYEIINKYKQCIDTYSQPKFYTKCYICDRYLKGIVSGPDIIKFLDEAFNYKQKHNKIPYNESNVYLQLRKISIWHYHRPFDYFGHYIKNRYDLTSSQLKNIYQSINELYGLPLTETINEKAEYIVRLIINERLYKNNKILV